MTASEATTADPAARIPSPRAIPQRAYLACVALTVCAYGSPTPFLTALATFAFAMLTLVSLAFPVAVTRVRGIQILAASIAIGLGVYSYCQTLPLPLDSPLANPVWSDVAKRLGNTSGSISVAPGMTLDALPTLALPFLAFLSGLALFQGDDEAIWLWKALTYFGAAFAIFGLIQEIAFPEQLLLETKKYYLGYLTGTFVNRNTAGTFLGTALVASLALFFHDMRSVRLATMTVKVLAFELKLTSMGARAIAHALMSLVVVVALSLTQSRAAVGATFIGATLMVAIFAMRPLTADKSLVIPTKFRRAAVVVGAVVIVAGAFALFGERAVYRMQEGGTDDSRWCAFASTAEAIQNNWPLGAGFGAFQDVFPMYRHFDCAGIFGVWERAHNVYLEGLLGFGALFPVALAVGAVVLLASLIRGVRRRHRRRFIPVAGLAMLVLVALHSVVDFSLQIPGFAAYFAALMSASITVSLAR